MSPANVPGSKGIVIVDGWLAPDFGPGRRPANAQPVSSNDADKASKVEDKKK